MSYLEAGGGSVTFASRSLVLCTCDVQIATSNVTRACDERGFDSSSMEDGSGHADDAA